MQVTRFENGLGVVLPASVIDAFDLHEGDEVDIAVTPLRSASGEQHESVEQALATLRRFRGRLKTAEFRFDREEVNARR